MFACCAKPDTSYLTDDDELSVFSCVIPDENNTGNNNNNNENMLEE